MPDPGSDLSDTALLWLRDLVAARLGVEPAAIDPGQGLHRNPAAQRSAVRDALVDAAVGSGGLLAVPGE
jgi:hypothetical protein